MREESFSSRFGKILGVGGLVATLTGFSGSGVAGEIPARLVDQVQSWATHPTVLITLRNRNQQFSDLEQHEIDSLDRDWRRQTSSDKQPLIAEVTGAPLSMFLLRQQARSGGQFIEVFVMDARGLNAGISAVTSDYWQGDEPKFQRTFRVGADAVFFGDVERKGDTGHRAQQISFTITDPDTGKRIGAITAEVNLDVAELYAPPAQR